MAYYFRLPIITDLTIEQQAVLNEPGPIAVSGGPGTGKSVVALWRHIRNHDTGNRKSLLLTYTVTLESYLASSGRTENEEAGQHVSRTYHWTTHSAYEGYDEILIDEAQDVNIDKYYVIRRLTPMVSYSADNNQILYPNQSTTEDQLRGLFNNNINYTLRANYRNTREIVQFVRSIFPDKIIPVGNNSGPKPQLVCSNQNSRLQANIIADVIREFSSDTHNIAILLPLKKHVKEWFEILTAEGFSCSTYTNDLGEIGLIENIHITTYKSCKGLEFDTVIVPNFDKFESNIQYLNVVERNDYYVVFTRARRNLLLLDNSPLVNNNTGLDFLRTQIARNIIDVDYTHVNPDQRGANIIEDELPF